MVGLTFAPDHLIKNRRQSFALSGGYIVGRADLVRKVAARLSAPGWTVMSARPSA